MGDSVFDFFSSSQTDERQRWPSRACVSQPSERSEEKRERMKERKTEEKRQDQTRWDGKIRSSRYLLCAVISCSALNFVSGVRYIHFILIFRRCFSELIEPLSERRKEKRKQKPFSFRFDDFVWISLINLRMQWSNIIELIVSDIGPIE